MFPLLVSLFALSGAAGLIYESIWSRYLALFVGHSAYAQLLVLVIFLGGMSAGALAAGARSARLREPLFAYAVVEAAVGLLGLVFHSLFTATTSFAYDHLFPGIAGTPWLAISKWTLAGLLILPSSVLLGATFPLMSAGLIRRVQGTPGRVLAGLYFANSLGAAIGVLVSGFYLVGAAGLPGTVAAAAILNLVVAILVIGALGLEREASRAAAASGRRIAPVAPPPATPFSTTAPPRAGLARLLLLVSFGTAVSSFIYEIAWTRMLSLVLGSATHSFELMLSAFILGLALGALWMRRRIDAFRDPMRALGWIQWAMGLLAVGTLPLYASSFHWTRDLMVAFSRTDSGYQLFTLARYGLCLAIMLPATFCAGMTLPLLTRLLMAGGGGERAIGQVYGINTLGSIFGAALAALVLLPVLGLKWMLVAGAAVDAGLGLALLASAKGGAGAAARKPSRLGAFAPLASAAGFLALLLPALTPLDRDALTSGVFRYGKLPAAGENQLLFYRDGRTATVSIKRSVQRPTVTLATNGKPDASLADRWLLPAKPGERITLNNDESTQVLLALLTLAHAPTAREGAVIGLGSGVSSHYLLGSPHLAELATIEIEPEMVRAARAFYPANARVYDDPRSHVVIDDAKSYFASCGRRFDLILSEPSNPWVSGVAGLFTTEFYRRIGTHLTPDGVFGQWLHLYELNDRLALSVVAAIHENFRSYEVFMVSGCDVLILATNRTSGLVPDWSVAAAPAIARDLARIVPLRPHDFEAMRLASRTSLAPLVAEGVRPNSDYFPTLDLGAERARFLLQYAEGFEHLNSDRFNVATMIQHRRLELADRPESPTPEIPRARAGALSAWLRETPAPKGAADPASEAAQLRVTMLEAMMASGAPPSDWAMWTRTALLVEEDLHGGAAGAVDESYYQTLERYLTRNRAPREAFAAVHFVHDLAAWEYERAAREAEPLIAAALRGEEWIGADLLRDGAVTARLLTGDQAGARQALAQLAPRVHRAPQDLRSRLLVSYVAAVSEQPAPEMSPAARR